VGEMDCRGVKGARRCERERGRNVTSRMAFSKSWERDENVGWSYQVYRFRIEQPWRQESSGGWEWARVHLR
jgi:hypothetical protein